VARVNSYVILLDLECDAFVLDIFLCLLVSSTDDHSCLMLAYIESILIGILDETNDM